MSCRLVAAMTTMPACGSKPSISTSSWLSVCSRSSWLSELPPRLRPTASSSSMKTMQDLWRRASLNRRRTRAAPTPAYISTKSEPLAKRNGTPASPAIERASSVLPVPGGPTSSTPFGMRPPMRREALRMAQEVDDLLDLVLRLVDAGDVLEGDDLIAALGELRAARRVDAARGRAVDREADQREERRRDGRSRRRSALPGSGVGCTSTRTLRRARSVMKRRVGGEELGRRHRLRVRAVARASRRSPPLGEADLSRPAPRSTCCRNSEKASSGGARVTCGACVDARDDQRPARRAGAGT